MNKIYCVLIGHNYIYEVQVITQVFFANSRFAFLEDLRQAPKEGYTVVARSVNRSVNKSADYEQQTSFTCGLYQNGQKLASHTRDTLQDPIKEPVKRTLMLALFYALKEATGQSTPWGALTGIRPAKQVRIWLEEGDTDEEITKRLNEIYKCREDKINLAITVARAEERMIAKMQPTVLNNICLYVGIPFCPSRCLYCSFVTSQNITSKNENKSDTHKRYLQALADECKAAKTNLINAIYIGGGTPTALSEEDLATLLELVEPFAKKGAVHSNIEYTVEAGRPDSITMEKLKLLKSYGVNRIAINPQTLNDGTLKRIGRMHTVQDFYDTFGMARQVGFDNINVDIIAGLPGEDHQDMLNTMEGLKRLMPDHITVHTLAVKRASRLNANLVDENIANKDLIKKGLINKDLINKDLINKDLINRDPINKDLANEKTVDAMLSTAQEICESIGLKPYYMYRQKNMVGHFENVGYSRPGCECIYNVAMMAEVQSILALGAGAVTKIIDYKTEGTLIRRKFNPKDVETYIKRETLKSLIKL